MSHLPPLLPPLLLLLKLSQWWYSPASPRHIAITSSVNDIAKTHAAILPPRPLPILPGVELHPHSFTDADTEATEGLARDPPPPYDALNTPNKAGSPETTAELVNGRKTYAVDAAAYGTCPLCGDKWKNPAALPTGWVVCWRCGWDALEGEGGDAEDGEDTVDESEAENAEGAAADEASREKEHQEGLSGAERTQEQSRRQRTKGRCPITGVPIGRGQLRRVLV